MTTPPPEPSGPEGYSLSRRLGAGAFGEVWRATAPGGVAVAIKILSLDLDPAKARREFEALQPLRELRHPYLLAIQAIFSEPERILIVMELADGSLAGRLAECQAAGQPGIPPLELLRYVREAAEALDFLHGHNVLHCDVKPDNILLVSRHVKVADYGLARVVQKQQTARTDSVRGTPAFIAPETWEGSVGPRSDQYSLAASYVGLRTGHPVFRAENLPQLAYAHLHHAPDLTGLSAPEEAVLKRALAKTAAERFPSCTAFTAALAAALRAGAAPAAGTEAIFVQPLAEAPKRPRPQPNPATQKAKPRKPAARTMAGIVVDEAEAVLPSERPRRRGVSLVVALTALTFLGGLGLAGWVALGPLARSFATRPLVAGPTVPTPPTATPPIATPTPPIVTPPATLPPAVKPQPKDPPVRPADPKPDPVKPAKLGPREAAEAEAVKLLESKKGKLRKDGKGQVVKADLSLIFVTDDMLATLRACRNLRELELIGGNITDAGMEYLAELPLLEDLTVCQDRITGKGLGVFGKLPRLKGLSLGYLNRGPSQEAVTSRDMDLIAACGALEKLTLERSHLPYDCLGFMPKLTRLRSLEISDCNLSTVNFSHIGKSPSIEELTLRDPLVDTLGAIYIARMTQLKSLDLPASSTALFRALGARSAWKALEEITLRGTGVREDDVLLLQKIPTLKVIHTNPALITERVKDAFRKTHPRLVLRPRT